MTDADIARLQADARGAAELRRAFNRAAEEFHAAGEMNAAQRAAWTKFYAAIVDSEAGVMAFAEMATAGGGA